MPSAVEAREIETSLTRCRDEVIDLDAGILKTLDTLRKQRGRHDVLKERIFRLESLASPARRLLPEIASSIFEYCLSYDIETTDLDGNEVHFTPLVLSQVCARWRALALQTPRLWTSIRVRFNLSHFHIVEIIQRRCKMLRTWLERSGSHLPLDVDIRCSGEAWGGRVNWQSEASRLVFALLPYSVRWRSLILHLSNSSLSPLWEAMMKPLPKLVRLILADQDPTERFRHPASPKPNIQNIPQLRQLSLTLQSFDTYDCVPWNHLTSMSLMGSAFSLIEAAAALKQCINLKDCSLDLGNFTRPPLQFDPIVLPHLERLDFVASSVLDLQDLFSMLSLPQLQQLTIMEGWDVSAVVSFLSRLSNPLKSFSLESQIFDIPQMQLLQCLQAVPALVSLSISSVVEDEVICALTPSGAPEALHICPQLKSLRIKVAENYDEVKLAAMIEGRLRVALEDDKASRLEKIYIDFEGYCLPGDALRHCFVDFKNQGLEITYNKWEELRGDLW